MSVLSITEILRGKIPELGGSGFPYHAISVPIKVSGDLENPDVTFLSPSAIGTRLLNILENILELPVEIILPVLPHKKEEQK